MTEPIVKKTNSGFSIPGNWEDICSFTKELEDIIEIHINDEDSIKEFNGWRPKEEETEKEVEEKTAQNASISPKKVEKDFNGTKKEFSEAGENIKKSVNDLSNGKNPSVGLKDASKNISKVIGAKSLESVRKIERMIYEKIMLKFNPYYFDTEHFSVNLEEGREGKYILTLNIPDEDLRKKISIDFERDDR
ncbi:MAG: DUF5828 family protein [Candidatus Saliniplasma sp.]